MNKLLLVAFITTLGLVACFAPQDSNSTQSFLQQQPKPHSVQPNADGTIPGTFREVEGVWQWENYGQIVHFSGHEAQYYDLSSRGCVLNENLDRDEFMDEPLLWQNQSKQQFTSHYGYEITGVTQYSYKKLDQLPVRCEESQRKALDNPQDNFEIFWEGIHQHQAFLASRNIDWEQIGKKFRSHVNDDTSDEQLLRILTEMMHSLEDGHGTIEARLGWFSFVEIESQKLENRFPQLLAEYHGRADREDFDDFEDFLSSLQEDANRVLSSYLAPPEDLEIGSMVLAPLQRNKNVAYLNISSMSDYADTGVEESAAITRYMDTLMPRLHTYEALVIDIRQNFGGEDAVAMKIASYFNETQRLAITKQVRTQLGFTSPQKIFLEKNSDPFLKPIYLLTSPFTVSGAETLSLAFKTLPHVTIVGQRSHGAHSDSLGKALPNGWIYKLSNEVYRDHQGILWENLGIEPDLPIPGPFSQEDRQGHKDSSLDLVLKCHERSCRS